jgi:hypothetical protein
MCPSTYNAGSSRFIYLFVGSSIVTCTKIFGSVKRYVTNNSATESCKDVEVKEQNQL